MIDCTMILVQPYNILQMVFELFTLIDPLFTSQSLPTLGLFILRRLIHCLLHSLGSIPIIYHRATVTCYSAQQYFTVFLLQYCTVHMLQ